MSLHMQLVAACMYAEVLALVVLLLPIISPKRWHSFFKSNFLKSIKSMAGMYFKIFAGLLCMCFIDAIREMCKYGGDAEKHSHGSEHLDVEMQQHMRLFRAQRNYYISGFALILSGVLYRLTTLISDLALSQISAEASMSQARSASAAVETLLKDQESSGASNEDKKKEEVELAKVIKDLMAENTKLQAEKDSMKKQAEGITREYDGLLEKHTELQGQMGGLADKKVD